MCRPSGTLIFFFGYRGLPSPATGYTVPSGLVIIFPNSGDYRHPNDTKTARTVVPGPKGALVHFSILTHGFAVG